MDHNPRQYDMEDIDDDGYDENGGYHELAVPERIVAESTKQGVGAVYLIKWLRQASHRNSWEAAATFDDDPDFQHLVHNWRTRKTN